MELSQGDLSLVRDCLPASSRNTSKGALLKEAHAVFSAVRNGLPLTGVRQAILDGEVLQKTSCVTRKKVWDVLKHRDFSVGVCGCATCGSAKASTCDGSLQ